MTRVIRVHVARLIDTNLLWTLCLQILSWTLNTVYVWSTAAAAAVTVLNQHTSTPSLGERLHSQVSTVQLHSSIDRHYRHRLTTWPVTPLLLLSTLVFILLVHCAPCRPLPVRS